jgi:bacteriocin biosynthesis cyclodehydratase domain-containing protein
VGPLFVPGQTGCFECVEERFRAQHPLFDQVVAERTAKPSPTGTFGPACAIVGGWVASDIVHYLTQLALPGTVGAACVIDLRSMTTRSEPVPSPGCPVCV